MDFTHVTLFSTVYECQVFFLFLLFSRIGKTVGQTLIRYSVQMGYITIPKTVKPARIIENADVFEWSIPEQEMTKLVRLMSLWFSC